MIAQTHTANSNDAFFLRLTLAILYRAGLDAANKSSPHCGEARDALTRWLAIRPKVDTPALFVSQMLQRIVTRSIERVVGEYGRKAKLESLTSHMLRHTFAKTLVDKGVPIEQVAALLGHSNLNTTRVYTTPGERDLERAVELIGEV